MNGSLRGDRRVYTEAFSDVSLGESTRSLLSAVYDDGGRFEPSQLSEGSLSSDDETDNEILHMSKRSEKDYSFEFERSNSSAKHRKDRHKWTPTNSSNSAELKKSSTKTTRSASSRSNTESRETESANKTAENKGDCLSPWETWLVHKTAEGREKTKQARLQKKKEKEQSEKAKREREELLKQASGKYAEWLENKKKAIAEDNRKKRLQEQIEQEKKQNSNRLILEKATVKYNNWLEDKKTQEKEKKREEEDEASGIWKDREVERKLLNEESYSRWIAEVKERPRPVYNSFGYTGGMLTGYYEWGHSIFYPHPPYGRGWSKLSPQEKKIKVPTCSPPLRNNPIFLSPLRNIQKIKGADTATPPEMTFKAPPQKISSIGRVWFFFGMAHGGHILH